MFLKKVLDPVEIDSGSCKSSIFHEELYPLHLGHTVAPLYLPVSILSLPRGDVLISIPESLHPQTQSQGRIYSRLYTDAQSSLLAAAPDGGAASNKGAAC